MFPSSHSHKLRMQQGMEILAAMQSLENPDEVCSIFFKKLDNLYTLDILWKRTREIENRQEAPQAIDGFYDEQSNIHQQNTKPGNKESHHCSMTSSLTYTNKTPKHGTKNHMIA